MATAAAVFSRCTGISDVSALSGMTALETLSLSWTAVEDVTDNFI